MEYPFKYPELYAEAARQGVSKKALAGAISITVAGLRYKQSPETSADFEAEEMKKLSSLLKTPAATLFQFDQTA